MVPVRPLEVPAPCAIGTQRFPVITQPQIGFTVSLVFSVNEQIEVDSQSFCVEACGNPGAFSRIGCGLFRRPVSITKGQLHSVSVSVFNKQADQLGKPALFLSKCFAQWSLSALPFRRSNICRKISLISRMSSR